MNPNENQPNQSETQAQQPTQNNNTGTSNTQSSGKLMSVLSYIGILVIIPLITSKNNPTVKFHIQQGLVLLVIEVIAWFLGTTFYSLWRVMDIIHLATFVLAIVGIVNALGGKQKELPLIGQFAHHFKI